MKVIRTGGRTSFVDLPLEVNWELTMRCNYRCSYCFQRGKGKTPPPQLPFSTLEQLKTAVDNIASLNRPFYNIVFSGGEPTFHPHIFELISMFYNSLGNRLNHITLITNGSRNGNLYEKIGTLSKFVNFTLCVSIHTDHVDMSHILEIIENLSGNINIFFALMFNPDKRDMVHEIYDTLLEYRKKFQFNMGISTLRDGDIVDPRYTQEDFDWQKKAFKQFNDLAKSTASNFPARRKSNYSNPVIHDIEDNGEIKTIGQGIRTINLADGLLKFKGMYCIAHAYILNIMENGLCRGMACGDDKFIANVFEKNSLMKIRDKLIHAVRCTKSVCGCSANDPIPKFASEEEAKKYVEFAQKRQAQLFDEYKQPAPPQVKQPAPPQVKQPAPPQVEQPAPPQVKQPAPPQVKQPAPPQVKQQAAPQVKQQAAPQVKQQATPPVKQLEYNYNTYVDLINNTFIDISSNSFRNSF